MENKHQDHEDSESLSVSLLDEEKSIQRVESFSDSGDGVQDRRIIELGDSSSYILCRRLSISKPVYVAMFPSSLAAYNRSDPHILKVSRTWTLQNNSQNSFRQNSSFLS